MSARRIPVRWCSLVFLVGLVSFGFASTQAAHTWWNSSWRYRATVTAGSNGVQRFDKPVDVSVNFTQWLTTVGASGTFDETSIRVVEYSGGGTVVNADVPFQFDKDADYNASSKASGNLVFIMGGTTGSSTSRTFDVYFEVVGGSHTPATVAAQMSVNPNSFHGGFDAFQINGVGTTYYYQPVGGAFSGMYDKGGNDWITYSTTPAGDGDYRGIPNSVFPESRFHPGRPGTISTIEHEGPVKVTLHSITDDGLWECRWEIYPRYATMTMLKVQHNYWFLYEGVPGGVIEDTDFMYHSDGSKYFMTETQSGDIPGEEWAFFGDPGLNRSMFFAHHEQDAAPETFSATNMTVFGFGRASLDATTYLTGVPQHFTMGFTEGTEFNAQRDSIRSSYLPLSVSAGTPEAGGVVVNLKAMLQGPYVAVNDNMRDSLTNVLPLNHPYGSAPWSYAGIDSVLAIPPGVVDWVLVTLRSGTAANTGVDTMVGFIRKEGTIVGLDGTSPLVFTGVTDGEYYVVVRHRNHLAIMSANAVALDGSGALYDFTTAASQAYGSDGQKGLGTGGTAPFGMYAGDGNADGQITNLDFDVFNPKFTSAAGGYQMADWNLDALVTSLDFSLFNPSFTGAKATRVP